MSGAAAAETESELEVTSESMSNTNSYSNTIQLREWRRLKNADFVAIGGSRKITAANEVQKWLHFAPNSSVAPRCPSSLTVASSGKHAYRYGERYAPYHSWEWVQGYSSRYLHLLETLYSARMYFYGENMVSVCRNTPWCRHADLRKLLPSVFTHKHLRAFGHRVEA